MKIWQLYQKYFVLLKKILTNIFSRSLIFFGLICFCQVIIFKLPYNEIYIFIFLLFIAYAWATHKKKHQYKLLIIIVSLLVELAVGAYMLSKESSWGTWPHDGLTQTTVAVDYFLDGKNPYQENYYKTALDNTHDTNLRWVDRGQVFSITNPALEHYVYFPLYFALPAGLSLVIPGLNTLIGLRIYLLFFLLLGAYLAYKLPPTPEKKLISLMLLAFPPLLLHTLQVGYFDIVPLSMLLLGLYFLKKQKYSWSIFLFCLAALVKQNYLFYLPFLFAYIFYKSKFTKSLIWVPLLTFGLVLLPFIFWCPACFYQDTFYYLGHIYPIRGIGLSVLMLNSNLISTPFDYWPFGWLQAIWLVLALPFFLYRQKKHNTINSILLYGTIVIGGYWYLARYFTGAHLMAVLQNILLSLFL